MLRRLRLSALVCLVLSSICGFVLATGAAVRVEGVTEYEVLSAKGRVLLVLERFAATTEKDCWLLRTELLSTEPQLSRPEIFCPPKQQVGSDGQDVYYLKEMPHDGAVELVGWVEPGPAPNLEQSPAACLVWLAFCSGPHLAGVEQPLLNAPWVVRTPNQNRQNKCLVPVAVEPGPVAAGLLGGINFLSDGRVDACNPDRNPPNILAPPWDQGFTQAVFRVQQWMPNTQEDPVPQSFSFELRTPVPRADPPRLRVMGRISANVTNLSRERDLQSWLPALPVGSRVIVRDYRFTDKVTNWQSVGYAISGQWGERTSQVVTTAVKLHEKMNRPKPAESRSAPKFMRALLLCSILLLLFGGGWWLRRKMK